MRLVYATNSGVPTSLALDALGFDPLNYNYNFRPFNTLAILSVFERQPFQKELGIRPHPSLLALGSLAVSLLLSDGRTNLLSGIQINTSPDTLDYFHPLRFDNFLFLRNSDGNLVTTPPHRAGLTPFFIGNDILTGIEFDQQTQSIIVNIDFTRMLPL